MLAIDEVGLGLPLHAEGRIGQHVVELVMRKVVIREAVAEGDVVDVLALDHHVRAADGVCLSVIVLAENFKLGVGIELANVVLSHGEHAAGPASRVVEGLDDALGGQHVAVGHEQQVDHQADDLARCEVIARLLVRRLVESPDQFLEDVAHLDVGDPVGMEVDLAEARDDQVETVGLVEPGNVLLEAETLDDLTGAGGEALDVVGEVGGDVVRVALELLEGEAAGVVERHAGNTAENGIDVLDLAAGELLLPVEHLVLRGLQNAVKPPQHG